MSDSSDDVVEIRWDLWWVWYITVIAAGLGVFSLIMIFARPQNRAFSVGICLGCAVIAPLGRWFLKHPPLTGRLTPTHLEIKPLSIPWADVLDADVFETRFGGLQFHAGIRLTDEGRKRHGQGFTALVSDFDLSVGDSQCAMGVHELVDEINRRASLVRRTNRRR